MSRITQSINLSLALLCLVQTAILFSLGLSNYHSYFSTTSQICEAIDSVSVCALRRQRFSGHINSYGKIKATSFAQIKAPSFQGYNPTIKKICVKSGDTVKKGQTIISFTCQELACKLLLASKDEEGAWLLYRKNLSAKNAVTDFELKKSKIEYEKAEGDHKLMKTLYSHLDLKSPFKGIVNWLDANIGESPEVNKSLFSIVNQDTLNVEFHIDSSNLNSVQEGVSVLVEVNDRATKTKRWYDGKIISINPAIDSQSGRIRVTAVILGKTEGLVHNMHVNVCFLKKPLENVFVVPRSALMESNQRMSIARVEQILGRKTIQTIPIKCLDYNHEWHAIESDMLSDGDIIVIEGSSRSNGKKVNVTRTIEI